MMPFRGLAGAISLAQSAPWVSFGKHGAVCGVQEYAESRRRGFGFREQAQYLGEGAG